jgi:hypothetical protein
MLYFMYYVVVTEVNDKDKTKTENCENLIAI